MLITNLIFNIILKAGNDMLAFGVCSHGLAETVDGDLKVAFSDQLYLLEKLLKKKMKNNQFFPTQSSIRIFYTTIFNFQFLISQSTDAEN